MVRYTVGMDGSRSCISCSVRQSKDWIVTRSVTLCSLMAPISRSTMASGDTVSSGRVGLILVSMLKPTWRPATALTIWNTSTSRGIRVRSAGCCSLKVSAYEVPGLMRPTS